MNVRTIVCLTAVALLATAGYLPANPPPDPISIDAHSPSIPLCVNPKNPADIYGLVGGGNGCDVNPFGGPVIHVPAPNYGVTAQDENDGHSAGERDPFAPVAIYFSGDRASQGLPGTEYEIEENNFQAAGDRFVTNGLTVGSPAMSMAACAPTTIGPPAFPGRPANILSVNQDQYNEIPSIGASVLNRNRILDNMDAVELQLFDIDGDNIHDRPIYFTVDKVSPSYPGGPSDILFSPPGAPGFAVFSFAPQIGLTNRDNVDALAVYDVNGNGIADPGLDYVVFSLDRGSPSLGGSAADLFVSDFNGFFCLFLKAADLGLARCDNVDAVDVEMNEVEVFEEPPVEEQVGTIEPPPVP